MFPVRTLMITMALTSKGKISVSYTRYTSIGTGANLRLLRHAATQVDNAINIEYTASQTSRPEVPKPQTGPRATCDPLAVN